MKKLKTTLISDTHGFHNRVKIEPTDILIHAGDSTNYKDIYKNEKEFKIFLDWISTREAKYIIMIAGNHDSSLLRKYWKDAIKEAGVIYLEHEYYEIEGKKFFGSPYTPTFGDWSFMVSRQKLDTYWEVLEEGIDVLITHGPPKGVLDIAKKADGNIEFCGDSALMKAVNKVKPKYHVFGHIHCLTPDYQVLTNEGWKYYNEITTNNKVLNYNLNNNSLEYDDINEIIINNNYSGDIYEINNCHFDKKVTPNHKLVYIENDIIKYDTVSNIYNKLNSYKGIKIPTAFDYKSNDYDILDNEIKLMVWVAADGNREGNRWRFHLKKERKIKRLENLLNEMNIPYNKGIISKKGSLKISFVDKNFKYLKPLSNIVKNFSKRQCNILIEEYLHTDGNFTNSLRYPNCIGQISSSKKEEVDLLLEVLLKTGYSFIGYNRKLIPNHCNINISKKSYNSILKKHITKTNYNGIVWCLNTNNGNFFIRKEGKVMLTGNSKSPIINHGIRIIDNTTFINASMVEDGKFGDVINKPIIIEI